MKPNHHLDTYNREVLACQDQAFTLASDLLSDDAVADAVVRQACLNVYRRLEPRHRDGSSLAVRLSIFREIVRLSRESRQPRRHKQADPLRALGPRQREALLLVDRLHLTYDQAAAVLQCPRHQLVRRLARARATLTATVRPSLTTSLVAK